MNLTIKPEYLDSYIKNPFTNKMDYVLLIDPALWESLFNSGYSFIFDINEPIVEPKEKKK